MALLQSFDWRASSFIHLCCCSSPKRGIQGLDTCGKFRHALENMQGQKSLRLIVDSSPSMNVMLTTNRMAPGPDTWRRIEKSVFGKYFICRFVRPINPTSSNYVHMPSAVVSFIDITILIPHRTNFTRHPRPNFRDYCSPVHFINISRRLP
jgi:hypothetical protein